MRFTSEVLGRFRREVQLIAAIPIPASPAVVRSGPENPTTGTGPSGPPELTIQGSEAEHDLLRSLSQGPEALLACQAGAVCDPEREATSAASRFVQLVYPWARTHGSTRLPEGLECPDGVVAGLLARNALTRGTFRSAAHLRLARVHDVYPLPRRDQLFKTYPAHSGEGARGYNLLQRVSVLGWTAEGWALLSDVTASPCEWFRPASVSRLFAAIIRAARRLGEELVFEPSNERLWDRLQERLHALLLGLWRAEALRGATAAEAFRVRCDRSTMSQNDLDNGRLIARIEFAPTTPIERITIALMLDSGGQVSLLPAGLGAP